ncbi:F-box/kelch-repeat protein At3g23880 isoform X2 [Cajanus cajan]|uniref:F-box/kelch-repeat protein At3g23880 isoform X2 n=1 Tax=Cajanus cajan TaxID=3821 RepID=UPI0010FAD3F9|nr:F-box/kelch-repeat protein At3g23880 isoform X2 [Cajanus cajan]
MAPATAAADTLLPIELIQEILLRLPVKLLLQLRCVCKSWKTLISDPQFAKNQLRRSPPATHLILSFTSLSEKVTLRTYPLRSVFNAVTVTPTVLSSPLRNQNGFDSVVGSCGGIICFAVEQSPGFLVLWNPTIAKFNTLPPLREYDLSDLVCGFGYDSATHTYKVVAVYSFQRDSVCETEANVLALGTNMWRTIHDFPSVFLLPESGKFVGGSLNWLASGAASCSRVIVSLDLGNELCEEVPQPDYGGVHVVTVTLGVLRDCLCLLSHGNTSLDVWLMGEYGSKESWDRLFSFYVEEPGYFPYTKMLCHSEDDQVWTCG